MGLRLREAIGPLPATDPDDYRKILNQLLAEVGEITGSAETAMIRVLDEARKTVIAELAELALDSGTAQMYQRTLEGIDEAIANLAQTMGTTIADYQKQGFAAGVDLATKPLAGAKGFEIVAASIGEDQLQILSRFSADLIQDVTSTLRTRINGEIASVVVGAKTPGQAATAIGKNLTSKNHFSTIAHRARAIVVTETGRAQALGTQAAQERLVKDIAAAGGGFQVRKQWLNAHLPGARQTHLEAEARYSPDGDPGPIPVDAEFTVAGFQARYPRDPSLPASESVNCHCVSLTVVIEGEPEIDDEPDEQPAAGLTAGQKFGPSVTKQPDLLYINAATGKAYAKKTPIYEVDGKLQTASGQPVKTQPKTIAIDNPDQKHAAQAAYTAAKIDASTPANTTTDPYLTAEAAKFLDDPYAAAGLKAEKPLANGTNGFGGEPMTKALGYPDPKMSGFVWDGDLGGWKHPGAPPGKQLPPFKGLKPHEQAALLENAKLHPKHKIAALKASNLDVKATLDAKPPTTPKPNVTPTPPPPPPVIKPAPKPKVAAKDRTATQRIPDEHPIQPTFDSNADAAAIASQQPSLRPYFEQAGENSKVALSDYGIRERWKRQVMEDLAEALDDNVPAARLKEFLDHGPSHYNGFGTRPSEQIASRLVQEWAGTSGDSNPTALMMQKAVAEVFDLPWPPVGYTGQVQAKWIEQADDLHDKWSDITTTFVRQQYAHTQYLLEEMYPGQTHIRLNRGMDNIAGWGLHAKAGQDMVGLNPASSFSVDTQTSHHFGDTILYVDVPKERILGTPFTGYGCLTEFEYVVIGARTDELMSVTGKGQSWEAIKLNPEQFGNDD